MSLSAAVIRELIAAGLQGEALVAACERIEGAQPVARNARQERNARYYEARKERLNASENRLKTSEPSFPLVPPALSPEPPITPPYNPPTNPSLRSVERVAAPRTAKADGKGRGSRLAPDWQPSPDDRKAALAEGMPEAQVYREANKFRDYWTGRAGANGVKLDWSATWRNWVRRACEDRGWTPDAQPMARAGPPQPPAPNLPTDAELRAKWAAALAIPEPTDEERWIPN
jgi:hypothetical protein